MTETEAVKKKMPGRMGNYTGPWGITKENAHRFNLLARAKRLENKRKAQEELQALKDAPVERVIKAIQQEPIRTTTAELDEYQTRRLACVRAQLERFDAMLLLEEDPAKVDKLASATAKLAEQERIIAGRPLPGSRRPSKEPKLRPDSRSIIPE